MKIVVVFTLLICHCQLLQSQPAHVYKFENGYKAAIRFNFTGLIDPFDTNLSFGGEYAILPRWSVVADIAWITHSIYVSKYKGITGYMFRPAIRFYPWRARHTEFLEIVLFDKHINYRLEDWLGKDCVNGVPAYQQFQKFTYGKRVAGISLQGGFQTNLSANKRFRFEGYGGFGARFINQHVVGEENACYNISSRFFNLENTPSTFLVPHLTLGMRVIYCIRD